MATEPGPVGRLREDQLIWLAPFAPLKGIVEVDLRVLDGADGALRSAANTIASSGLGSDEHLLAGFLDAALAHYGGIDTLSPTGDLTRASSGLEQFESDLDERDGTLEP